MAPMYHRYRTDRPSWSLLAKFFFVVVVLCPSGLYLKKKKKSFSPLRLMSQSLICQKMVIAHLRVICILRRKVML